MKQYFTLDPRTKFLLLLFSALFVLSRFGGETMKVNRMILIAIPYALLLIEGKFASAFRNILLLTCSIVALYYGGNLENEIAASTCIVVGGILVRFLPMIVTGKYVIKTTKVSEFVAAMEKMHVSQKIIIPTSVMFRFMPTVAEEFKAIGDAMDMRGISFGGNKMFEMFEYRFVPMLICSVRIGEDLSAAAITRGLGERNKRTNMCKVGFHWFDYVIMAFAVYIIVRLILHVVGV